MAEIGGVSSQKKEPIKEELENIKNQEDKIQENNLNEEDKEKSESNTIETEVN